MRVDNKSLVVNPKVCLPHYLHLHLPELLPHCSSRVVEIVVNVLDVHDHEFAHPLSPEGGLEAVLPIRSFVDFKGLHRLDVNYMNKLRNLVHQHHRADATQIP